MRPEFFAAAFTLVTTASGLVSKFDSPAAVVGSARILESRQQEQNYVCEGATFGEQYVNLIQRTACALLHSPGDVKPHYPRLTKNIPSMGNEKYYRYPLLKDATTHTGTLSQKTDDYYIIIKEDCEFVGAVKRVLEGLRLNIPRTPRYGWCQLI